jgi:hypothetical protein
MADKKMQAQKVYGTVCAALDARNWKYKKDEPKLLVYFGVKGDDLPMDMVIAVDEDRQLIKVSSPLPFKMSEDKRVEGAVATIAASYGMADGSFDYDLGDGEIVFRMVAAYHNSVVGEGLIQYMISCSLAMVDKYNDQFLALDKGYMELAKFIENA